MDGLKVYNGNPYEQMDDLGVYTTIFGNTHIYSALLFHLVYMFVWTVLIRNSDPERSSKWTEFHHEKFLGIRKTTLEAHDAQYIYIYIYLPLAKIDGKCR